MTLPTHIAGHRSRGPTALVIVLLTLLPASGRALAQPRVLFDFDEPLSQDWSAVRELSASRGAPPAVADTGAPDAPSGNAVRVTTGGNAGLFTKPGRVAKDWMATAELSAWFYRSAEVAARHPQTTVEWQVYESDGKARFWRKLTVDHVGWKRYSVPLAHFRWGGGRIPRWDRVDRVGVWFRDAGDVWIDNVAVTPGVGPSAAELSTDELRRIAFPEKPDAQVRVFEKGVVRLITDAADLDADRLAAHLQQVAGEVSALLPDLPAPTRPVTLIVFAAEAQYRAFPGSLGRVQNAEAPAPQSDGFTLHGIATSSWDPKQGTLRPVYTHEFVHAMISQVARLDNRNEWFQEGLASLVQLRHHPQANIGAIIRQGLDDPDRRTPLADLCNGDRIPLTRYWQAMTVADLLTSDPAFRPKVTGLIEAFHRTGSTALPPHAQDVLGVSLEALEARWLEHCRAKW